MKHSGCRPRSNPFEQCCAPRARGSRRSPPPLATRLRWQSTSCEVEPTCGVHWSLRPTASEREQAQARVSYRASSVAMTTSNREALAMGSPREIETREYSATYRSAHLGCGHHLLRWQRRRARGRGRRGVLGGRALEEARSDSGRLEGSQLWQAKVDGCWVDCCRINGRSFRLGQRQRNSLWRGVHLLGHGGASE